MVDEFESMEAQLTNKETDGSWPSIGMNSFHPTREGHQLFGEVFTDALRKLGL